MFAAFGIVIFTIHCYISVDEISELPVGGENHLILCVVTCGRDKASRIMHQPDPKSPTAVKVGNVVCSSLTNIPKYISFKIKLPNIPPKYVREQKISFASTYPLNWIIV